MGFKEAFFGDGEKYKYGSLCALSNPFSKKKPTPVQFYGRGKNHYNKKCSISVCVKISIILTQMFE